MTEFFSFLIPESHNHFEILLILMVMVWGAGRIFKGFGLPPMLGEILAGVLLGPQVLGILEIEETIRILAELGVFFLMFHSGLDTDVREFLGRAKISVLVAIGGMVPIMTMGIVFMLWWGAAPITASFMGTVLALNSIPVIISVLKTYKLKNTKVGHTVLGATVANEILLFVILSVIISLAETGIFDLSTILFVSGKVLVFFGCTLFLGKLLLPLISPYILNRSGSKGFTFALIIALLFGLMAEWIGLHMILGAYLAGMFVREEITNNELMRKIEDRFYALSHSFLGPIFFASVGMTISFGILKEKPQLVFVLLAIVFVGQWVGSGLMAYMVGKFNATKALIVSTILSGRGSTEIVVAQIGFSTIVYTTGQPLITQEMFASLIALSFLSTLAMPILVKIILYKKNLTT